MSDDDFVRERLRDALARRGMSARKVALRAGLSANVVQKFLSGATKSPGYLTLTAIAAALDINVQELLGDESHVDEQSSARPPAPPPYAEEAVEESVVWAVLRQLEANQRAILSEMRALRSEVREVKAEQERLKRRP